jgi:predicted transcriptional regulator
MTNLSSYQEVINVLEQNNKPMTAPQIAEETNMTTQRAKVVLHTLYADGKVYKKCDGNKTKYSVKDFKTMDSFIEGYKWYAHYPYIIAFRHHTMVNMLDAYKGFHFLPFAIVYANFLSIKWKEEILIIDNR